MFCPKCGSIMLPKTINGQKFLACSCGHKMAAGKNDFRFVEKAGSKQSISVVEKEEEIHPLVDERCPKCGHGQARAWEIQTRSSDEPETRFYKCEKCKHTWRENT